jgi:3-hydroxybutyryl-CoA dehydrogenase
VRPFEKVGVVGAGMMGSEIALMFALAGHPTILSDQERAAADKALERLLGLIERGAVRGLWTAEQAEAARGNLKAVNGLDDHGDRDLVIEAVFESAELKRSVFTRLDSLLQPSAGPTSNTSSISISSLSAALGVDRRRRFVGTHFFSPASRMRLVEVVPSMDTDAFFADQVSEMLIAIGKTPIRVKDVVGFAVNRLLHALVIESIRLVEEGGVFAGGH